MLKPERTEKGTATPWTLNKREPNLSDQSGRHPNRHPSKVWSLRIGEEALHKNGDQRNDDNTAKKDAVMPAATPTKVSPYVWNVRLCHGVR
jgi:hypothetical protein